MKSPLILGLALLSFCRSCSSAGRMSPVANQVVAQREVQAVVTEPVKDHYGDQAEKVSLTQLDKAGETTEAAERKIIRNADITIEVPSTTDAQHQVTSIAETHGEFVVTLEATQRERNDQAQ